MITSIIGKIFLNAYNKRYGKSYDAKSFFNEVYYPLFFNSDKYLQWITNSPFVQMKKGQKIDNLTEADRVDKLNDLHRKIDAGTKDASVAIGYAASDDKEFATTSGQVSNINYAISKEDIYTSWIGSGLGIGLQGGLNILFSKEELLMDIYEGWRIYRNILDNNRALRGNQINTWNGQWLAHRYSRAYIESSPMANFDPLKTEKDDSTSITSMTWTKIIIAISKHFTNPKIMGYVYNLGQMNTTIGFIPFNLSQIRKPIELYQKIFGIEQGHQAENMWGTGIGFRSSCKRGVIGLYAMQPKELQQYLDCKKQPKQPKDKEQQTLHNTQKIWILAMLNNEELWSKSQEFAQFFLDYSKSGERTKTTHSREINEILGATNKKNFLSALTEIVKKCEKREKIMELAKLVHSMPADNIPYFLTLLRFWYASIN